MIYISSRTQGKVLIVAKASIRVSKLLYSNKRVHFSRLKNKGLKINKI